MVLALAGLTTGRADAIDTNFAQATAHLLDCDVPGGSVRFTPFGDDGVTMNLNLPAAVLADTPFSGQGFVASISSPGKYSMRFGVYDSSLTATAETMMKSRSGPVRVLINNNQINIIGLVEGGQGQEDGRRAKLTCNTQKFQYLNGKEVVNIEDINAFAFRVMKLLANDIRKNSEAIAPAKRNDSKPEGCWVRIGIADRIGLRNNPDGSATFEMPDTYPTAGIVLHPNLNSDQHTLIGGSAEAIHAVVGTYTDGGHGLQVQSANAILNGDCE